MADQKKSLKRWNLFARELADILAVRSLRLSHLDDRVGIHREKVRRLSQSLLRPKSFPMLNANEMEQVIQVFGLNDAEAMRLRAAILATSIEKTLMDRINQDDALMAAEQIFPIIFKAMQERVSGISGLGSVKGGELGLIEDTDLDLALELALEAIDAATMALHLSRNVASHAERIERARQARDGFEVALSELDEAEEDIRAMQAWHDWHDEAQRGLNAANERLEELGE